MTKSLLSIEFHKSQDASDLKFLGSVSLQDLMKKDPDRFNLNSEIKKNTKKYEKLTEESNAIMEKIRRSHSINQTRLKDMWKLGDKIHRFADSLRDDGFYLNGLYEHLVRDLGASRDLLKRVIIFRSHFPSCSLIPNNMLWKEVRDAPRTSAQELQKRPLGNTLKKE